jgi:hypothetical protein
MESVRDAEFNDPRLVEVYDGDRVSTRDDDYFAALVNEAPGSRVLDLGAVRAGSRFDSLRRVTRSLESIPPRQPSRQRSPKPEPDA